MWAKLFDHVKSNWAVFMNAKLAFIVLAGLGIGVGFTTGMFYYSGQVGSLHEQIGAKDGQISRYRVALGIDPASKGALIELNNAELAARALSTVTKLRNLSAEFGRRSAGITQQKDSGKLTDEQAFEQQQTVMKQVSEDFDKKLASDAENIRNELRTRLSPDAIAHIVRVPALLSDDGKSIPITALFKGTPVDSFFIGGLADEIEQMTKLLPPDSGKP